MNFARDVTVQKYKKMKFKRSDAEEDDKKAIYFCVDKLDYNDYSRPPGWLISDLCFTYIKTADSIMENMPIRLRKRRCYSVVAWNSKIYFIGGETWDYTEPPPSYKVSIENFSSEVFAFNVKNQQWDSDDSHPNMLLARASSIVVAADAKIFVFGSFEPGLFINSYDNFAEYYDINQGKWFYISDPPEALCRSTIIRSTAVVKNYILFYSQFYGCLNILNFATMEWLTMEEFFGYPRPEPGIFYGYPAPNLGPLWSNTVVTFYDALFWHHGSIIYAYDFNKGMNSVIKLCGFENTIFKDIAENSPWPDEFPATFLLSPEDGRLCLVWRSFNERPRKYYCQNFQVERHYGKLVIHVGSCPTLASLPDFGALWDVLLV